MNPPIHPWRKLSIIASIATKRKRRPRNSRKIPKASELKEVKMSHKIDVHDYGVPSKFIKQGNRVKCTIQFCGREMQHDKLGIELLNKIAVDMADICQMDGKPKREGRTLFSILSPKAAVTNAVNDKKRKEGREKKKKKSESKKAKAAGGGGSAAAVVVDGTLVQ